MAKLPRQNTLTQYNFDSDVHLEYYRLQKISEGSINLNTGYAQPLAGPLSVGTAAMRESPMPLSQLIDLINQRFGTDFNQADQLFFDQIVESAVRSEVLQHIANANSAEKFQLMFTQLLESLFMERMDHNETIFARYSNDQEFQTAITEWLTQTVYERLAKPQKISYKMKK